MQFPRVVSSTVGVSKYYTVFSSLLSPNSEAATVPLFQITTENPDPSGAFTK